MVLWRSDELKEIALLANETEYADFLKSDLEIYFKDYVKINTYCIKDIESMKYIREKFVVISAFTIFQKVKNKINDDSELIIASLTLSKEGVEKLQKLPKGTKALLVNIDYRLCMLVITTLYKLGFRDLDLIPYYDGIENYDKDVNIAITPDETHLVPKCIKEIINIGERVIDLNCIIEIADKLGLKKVLENREISSAFKRIVPSNLGIERMLGEKEDLTERIRILVNMMDIGIVITDIVGKIYLSNKRANYLLKSKSEIFKGFNISEILPEINNLIKSNGITAKNSEVIRINGNNLIINSTPIITNSEASGNIITIDNFSDVEKRQHTLRTKITGCGHNAQYDFSDIIGESEIIKNTKDVALRMAKSDSSILITGESGTGKELFAQSIHNNSYRKNYHFVAINCSALPENLLESELFGYEEGAFSGAKKGGKIGLFELAHKGTLFLDEMGEMPIMLQSKLLRVIEEKKIMKIGGRDLIDVDVRIIAATNRNLLKMVKIGSFRNDLYYRLNVLTLKIPRLRERGNDILTLSDYFRNKFKCSFTLSKKSIRAMKEYDWPGNIRELRNVMEYLTNLNKSIIEIKDLPIVFEFQENDIIEEVETNKAEQKIINKFILNEGRNLQLYGFILGEMEKSKKKRENIGRNKLSKIAEDNNLFITEQEIRNGLTKLVGYGFVVSGKGRKGSYITELGVKCNKKVKGLFGE